MRDSQLMTVLKRDVVVFDLEYTAWPGSLERGWSRNDEHREIVQIGAVRLAPDLTEVGCTECLVRPTVNSVLSDYFVSLTGISNADLDLYGVDLVTALRRLARFAAPDALLLSNGDDGGVVAESCNLSGTESPIAAARFVCIEDALLAALGSAVPIASSDLPAAVGAAMPGRAHTALADARAIALTLRTLRGNGVV